MRRGLGALAIATGLLSACGQGENKSAGALASCTPIPVAFAKTFSLHQCEGYRVVDIEASVVTWGGSAEGPAQHARLVLVKRDATAPELSGPLAGAAIIRTPVMRIAVNDQPHEAIIRALRADDRLVAVGGHSSYDDGIRARVQSGEIKQVGYGWHQVPTLDALVAASPDVFLARMADLTHTQHMERIRALGIPVVPTFIDAEPHYMGRVEWVLLAGLMLERETEAKAFVEHVASEIARLKNIAAMQSRRSVLWSWYTSGGDRWSVTQRNGDAALIRDANAELVLGASDDARLDGFARLSTEQLLGSATDADNWVIRDPLSEVYTNTGVLKRFKAYRDGNVFWMPGGRNPSTDAWEVWEMGVIRPDWLLADIIKMVHPPLRDGNWRLLAPETWEPVNGAGHH